MKLSSGLLFLLFLLTFTMDQQEAKVISKNSFSGGCVELCRGDWDCEPEEHCVSNGCSHICSDQYI
ncbi:protein Wfdc21-like [Phascolarctos cinereus]|uniref:Protein Wfdc21-like n=1 Tax=Phascolarctos cinereus TaxID=38626 RepID=A0A6P5LVM9_PHACI|nr:protein Wfdc21-like [Phascolarctos cinereus]